MTEEEQVAAEAKLDEQKENIPAPEDNITKANAAAERMETAVAAMKTQNDRTEALRVQDTLGGKADATGEKQKETPEEYADKVMRNDL